MTETKYLTGREYQAVLSLFAAVSHYAELFPLLKKRADLVPGLWDKMTKAQALTDEILGEIASTIPADKARHVLMDIQHVKLYVKVEPPGSVPTVDMTSYSYVPTTTLNELLSYVMENECLLCDKSPKEARKCQIRKIFTDALTHEVDAKDTDHCRYSDMSLDIDV